MEPKTTCKLCKLAWPTGSREQTRDFVFADICIKCNKPKTLAEFKRDINVGDSIIYVEREEANYIAPGTIGPLSVQPVPEKMAKLRLITYKDTTGFYLKAIDDTSKRGSFCNFPKTAELDYRGDTFTITEIDHNGNVWQHRTYKIIK